MYINNNSRWQSHREFSINSEIKLLNLSEQRGVSLIITFLIMTIMLAIVLSTTTILFNEIKIIRDIGDSLSSFNSASSGIEKTLYFDRKQIPTGASRGFCNICNVCTSNDCSNCTVTSLATDGSNGCNVTSCTNCEVTYNSSFDGRNYSVDAKVTPDPLNSNISNLNIVSNGFYNNTTRVATHTSTLVLNATPTTMLRTPAALVNDTSTGTQAWVNPSNAASSDNIYTTNFIFPGGDSNYLKATNFGFSIPSNATINDIQASVERKSTLPVDVFDSKVRIVKGGIIGLTDKSSGTPWPITDTIITYGSASDLWGQTWTPSDINASNFGFAISVRDQNADIESAISVDQITITVTYTTK